MSDYKVQSVLFDKKQWIIEDAVIWLMSNGYLLKKIDNARNYFRFRQLNPAYLKKKGYINYHDKKIGKGIILVLVYKELRPVVNSMISI